MLQGLPDVVLTVSKPARAKAIFADLAHEVIQLPLGIGQVFVRIHGRCC